jgi:phospholipid-translocating ATPase/phospholipid-transporting ATPase
VFTFWPVVIRAIFDEDLYYTSEKKSTLTGSRRLSMIQARAQIDVIKQNYPRLYYIG